MKKSVPLFLATALLLSSCASGESSYDSESSKTSSSSEKKELDVMLWYRDQADFQNMQFYKDLEAQTGIHANLTAISGSEWTTKTNLMFASGEYPDIILRGGVDIEMYGVDQKILIPLDKYIDEYMPTYKALLNSDKSLQNLLCASDGNMYQTGWLMPQNINVGSHLFINKQWLNNLKIEMPNTVEEFEAMLKAFRDNDPNQNGQKDEIPFTGERLSDVDCTLFLLSFWGIPYNSSWLMIDNNNKVTSQLLNENLRPALETISKWYKEGLMDVESVAQNVDSFEAKVNAGNCGSFWRWRMKAMGTSPDIISQYECIVPLSANGIQPQVAQYLEIPSFGAAITVDCKNIETACAWLDAQYEFENQLNAYYGPYKEEPKDGVLTKYGWHYKDNGKVEFFTADVDEIPGQTALHFMSPEEYFSKVDMPEQRIEKTTYCKMYTEAGVVEKYSYMILKSLCKFTPEEITKRDLLGAEIRKYAEEAIINFITKGVTDESWNTYQKTLENLKIKDYIKLYQDSYDRYQKSNS